MSKDKNTEITVKEQQPIEPWEDSALIEDKMLYVKSLRGFLLRTKIDNVLNALSFIKFSEIKENRSFELSKEWLFYEVYPWIYPAEDAYGNGDLSQPRKTNTSDWKELNELETNSLVLPILNIDITCEDDQPLAISKNFSEGKNRFTVKKDSKGATGRFQSSVRRNYVDATISMIQNVFLLNDNQIVYDDFIRPANEGGIGFFGAAACLNRFVQSTEGKFPTRSLSLKSSSGRDGQ